MAKRSTHLIPAVTYAAVGASQDPHVAQFPPEGFIGHEDEVLLGSGATRFRHAATELLTWGAQRGAGISVRDISTEPHGRYSGVVFDSTGNAVKPAKRDEVAYASSGEPLITPGTTATLSWASRRADRRVKVMYVIDEETRAGIALGTADAEGVIGEELFLVEQRPDGSVWGIVRGFLAAPGAGLLGLKEIVLVRLAVMSSRAQIRSLAPGEGIDD